MPAVDEAACLEGRVLRVDGLISVVETNDGRQAVHLAIYELNGDTLKICTAHSPDTRPTEFASKEGAKWPAVFVFERQKDK